MLETLENYLKAIFTLYYQSKEPVKPSAIAQSLKVSPAAVSEMLKKLRKKGYIDHSPYKHVALTPKGLSRGKAVLRRHRLWEMYLHKRLGYAWDEIHDEAEQLEHASSDELINRIEEDLGFPQFDPHGDPIPSRDGEIPSLDGNITTLSNGTPDTVYRVVRVRNESDAFLSHVNDLGIGLNTELELICHLPFDNSTSVKVHGKELTLSDYVSHQIFVVPVS